MSLYDKVIAVFGLLRDSVARRADKSDVAPDFSTSSSYKEGDLVFRDGSLYMCTSPHSGAWSGSDFVATTVDSAIAYRKSVIPGGGSSGSGGSGGSGSQGGGSGGGGDSPGGDDDVSKCPVEGGILTLKDMSGSVTVPSMIKVDYSKATDLSYHFAGVDRSGGAIEVEDIDSLTLGDGFGESATDISYCFASRGIKSISLPDGFGSSATEATGCFSNNADLSELTLPKGFGSRMGVSISDFLSGCSGLKTLNLPDDLRANRMDYFCRGCKSLSSLSWLEGGMYMTRCFEGCTSLTEVSIRYGSSVTGCFYGCTSLRRFSSSEEFGQSEERNDLVDMTDCFNGCTSLKTVKLQKYKDRSDYRFVRMFKGCESLTMMDCSKWFSTFQDPDLHVSTNANEMFSGCKRLSFVLLGDEFEYATNVSKMFKGCSDLSFDGDGMLPDGFGTNAGDVSECFSGCTSLQSVSYKGGSNESTASVVLPKGFGKSASSMSGLFSGCTGLSSVELSDDFGNDSADCTGLFSGCTSLQSVSYKGGANEGTASVVLQGNLKLADECFSWCTGLTSVEIPDGFGSMSLISCFKGCANLETFTGRAGSPSVQACFEACSKLSSLTFESALCRGSGECGNLHSLFYGCISLKSIDTDKLVEEGLCVISEYLFYGCSGLESVSISSTIADTYGASYMFSGCTSLKKITFGKDFGAESFPIDPSDDDSQIEDCFAGCTSLSDIEGGCIKFGYSFSMADCPLSDESLTTLIVGLVDRSGKDSEGKDLSARTLRLSSGRLSKAGDLTAEVSGEVLNLVAIASKKNWTLSE